MSGAPGVDLIERESPVSTSLSVDTATALIVGLAERGPVNTPVFCQNLAQFEAVFGKEVAYGYLWDAAKWIPMEGGSPMWFVRVVGPEAKASTLKLSDGDDDTLEVSAVSPGEWGDEIEVEVTVPGGGNFTPTVSYEGAVVEVLGPYADNAEAVQGVEEESAYIRLKDLGGGDPEAAEAAALEGGKDDRASITDSDREAGIDALEAELGAAQVLYPGATTEAIHTALLNHAEERHRTALLDGPNTATVGTITAAAAALRALPSAGCGGLLAPWAVVPGPTASAPKTIPYSIIQAALMARRDRETYDNRFGVSNPNEPAAGTYKDAGVSRFVIRLSQEPWTDTERGTLNDAGVCVVRWVLGQAVTYGYRTLANPLTKPLQVKLNNRRIDMAILAKADIVAERFNFRQVDGRGRVLSEFAGALRNEVLVPYYEVGALFGKTPDDAYNVDTSDQVNPVEELAKGNVRALIEAARSPFAEKITLEYANKEIA